MRALTKIGDQLALSATLICAVHCFLAPVLITLLPSFRALSFLNDDSFHAWMLVGVLPTSLFTLAMGCKKHKKSTFFVIGFLGLSLLFFTAFWGHQLLGGTYEKYLSLAGSMVIAYAHINNYVLCREDKCRRSDTSCTSNSNK